MKKQNSLGSAIKILWKVMTKTQKMFCVPMFFLLLVRPFAMLMPVQCIAAVVAKLEGEIPTIFGISLPADWSIVVVSIFVFSLVYVLWLIGAGAYYILFAVSGKISNQLNIKALECALSPKKNMDIKMSKGELCYIIKSSTDTIQSFIEVIFINIFPPIASFVLSLIYIGLIDYIVMIMVLLSSLLVVVCAYGRVFFEKKPIVNEEICKGKINNLFLSSVTNLPFVSLFKCLPYEKMKLDTFNNQYYHNIKKRSLIGWSYWAVVMLIEYGFMAASIIVANSHTITGSLTISSAVLLLGYILRVYDPIESLGYNIQNMQQYAIKINRINLIKPNNEDLISSLNYEPQFSHINKIEMKDIGLDFGAFKLNNINLTFNKGELFALVGPSGSGKTSIIQALLGLKEYSQGEIIVDGRKVRSLFFDDNKIALSLQEMQLFDKSLEENLLYPNMTLDENAKDIVKRLGIDKIINDHKDKHDGLERVLSGGQKKRINIARALIKPAEIYILDEPTNELDKKNVEIVLDILKEIKNRAIVIVVTHDSRLTNICDKVFYF